MNHFHLSIQYPFKRYHYLTFFRSNISLSYLLILIFIISVLGGCSKDRIEISTKTAVSITADRNGDTYILDAGEGQVLHLNGRFKFRSRFGSVGKGKGEMDSPMGMWLMEARVLPWVSSQNRSTAIFIADTGNARLQLFDSSGLVWSAWQPDPENVPHGIAVNRYGFYVTVPTRSSAILVRWKDKGVVKFKFPGGEGVVPWGIFADEKGDVWITDIGKDRIIRYDMDANLLGEIGRGGYNSPHDGLFLPSDVWVHGRYVYIADSGKHRVAVYSKEGIFIREFREDLDFPISLAVKPKSHRESVEIIVLDKKGVRIFGFDESDIR